MVVIGSVNGYNYYYYYYNSQFIKLSVIKNNRKDLFYNQNRLIRKGEKIEENEAQQIFHSI